MNRVATLILNRNLPKVTDKLYDHIKKYDGSLTDIYVIEAGSDDNLLSKYTSWHAKSPDIIKFGLRYSRGMNYGLFKLLEEGLFHKYDAFFLVTNDTELEPKKNVITLLNIMNEHKRLGILSPCSKHWGERFLLQHQPIKYFWFIHNNAYFLRREFIESVANFDKPNYINFLFDGENFRGYGSEHELIAKGYINDWAAAITNEVWTNENEKYLLENASQIKTESYEENLALYISEGKAWMKKKYGFNSHWSMQQYVKLFYDKFFEFHPEFEQYKI